MYFVYGNDPFLVEKNIKKLCKRINATNEYDIIKYSFVDNSPEAIINEINTYGLFSSKKIIILEDSWFVNETKVKMNPNFDVKYVEPILKHTNTDVEVIFCVNSDKISKKLKIAKTIQDSCEMVPVVFPNDNDLFKYISSKFDVSNLEYDTSAINLLISILPKDMRSVENELIKIVNSNVYINETYIKDNVTRFNEFDIFEISNSLMDSDVNKFLKGWKQYTQLNNDMIGFLTLISNSFITLRNIRILEKRGFNQFDIASSLKLNPYRVKMLSQIKDKSIDSINKKIQKIHLLNYNIFESSIDNKFIPEIELLKLMR